MVAIPAPDMEKEARANARADIDRRVEALLNSIDADTPDNPTAKNFGQQEVANLREYVKRATQEGLPTLTSSQMGELLAQAAEGKNIKPLDPKAEIRPEDPRTIDSMANAITALGGFTPSRELVASADARHTDPIKLSSPITPAQTQERTEVLAR